MAVINNQQPPLITVEDAAASLQATWQLENILQQSLNDRAQRVTTNNQTIGFIVALINGGLRWLNVCKDNGFKNGGDGQQVSHAVDAAVARGAGK